MKISTDIQNEISNDKIVILLMLDLSAAFDTIDQDILIDKLKNHFQIKGKVLSFLQSYLKNRTYNVSVHDQISKQRILKCGVPQGLILGPRLFSMYMYDLDDVVLKYGLVPHIYADDTNLYIGCKPMTEFSITVKKISDCFTDLANYMARNFLKLNVKKTQVMFCGRKTTLSLYETRFCEIYRSINNDEATCCKTGKTLGVTIDSTLQFKDMIDEVTKNCYYKLNRLQNMKKSLDGKIRLTLIKSLIISKLDYCNFLYSHAPNYLIQRLQKCLNAAVRFVFNVRKSARITPYLKSAHILPIRSRIDYKLCYYAYKILIHHISATHGSETPTKQNSKIC